MSEYHPDIESIVARLKAADVAYFTTGEPLMDDLTYDRDKGALRRMAPAHPYLTQVGSPVAHTPLAKVAHQIPMGSLDKAMNREEFLKWVEKTAKALGLSVDQLQLTASLKADGGSYSAEYRNGNLVRVLTRGDGKTGEDVTLNGRKFRHIPSKTTFGDFTGFVRFEGVLLVDDWASIDPEKLSNPRNVANGLGRRKDAEQAELITAFTFRIHDADGKPLGTHEEETLSFVKFHGFEPVPNKSGTVDQIWEWFESVSSARKNLKFWIDGVVVAVDSREAQAELGEATDFPRWAVAIKFPAETATTTIRAVDITVGHTGAIIPTARFDTVRLGGTNVESALLCNWDEIERLDVAVGDTVEVYKAGDIIPKTLRVTYRPADRKLIPRPTVCPVCGGPVGHKKTVDGEDSTVIYCLSDDCPAKVEGKLRRFLDSLDIQGIGDEILGQLPGELALHDCHAALAQAVDTERAQQLRQGQDLPGLQVLADRQGAGAYTASAAQDEIAQRGIRPSGKLAERAEEVGLPNTAEKIHQAILRHWPVVLDLFEAGVTISAPAPKIPVAVGAKSFCMTGTLSKPRAEIAAAIEAAGHVVRDAVAWE